MSLSALNTYAVAVACRNASDVADMPVFSVQVSEEDHQLGAHYALAESLASTAGYDGPFVCFDPDEHTAIGNAAEKLGLTRILIARKGDEIAVEADPSVVVAHFDSETLHDDPGNYIWFPASMDDLAHKAGLPPRPAAVEEIQVYESWHALKGNPMARKHWEDASAMRVNGWYVITAESHRVAALKEDSLIYFAPPGADFDNPKALTAAIKHAASKAAMLWASRN